MPNLYNVLEKIEKIILLVLKNELAKFWKQNQYTKKQLMFWILVTIRNFTRIIRFSRASAIWDRDKATKICEKILNADGDREVRREGSGGRVNQNDRLWKVYGNLLCYKLSKKDNF